MAFQSSNVRVDDVDGKFWIETPYTETATANLHALWEQGRQEPRPSWAPFFVLCGTSGSGKTAIATRFMAQAQRSITCTIVDRAREARDAPAQLPSADAVRRQQEAKAKADDYRQRVRDFGHCPSICAPARFTPEEELDRAIHDAMHGVGRHEDRREARYRHEVDAAADVEPAMMVSVNHKPGSNWVLHCVTSHLVRSPGDRSNDPLRRTSILFVDRADRLLTASDRERRIILQDIKDVPRPVTIVLIGSPELASAVQAEGMTHIIKVPTMEDGPVFEEVVRTIFGECHPEEVRRLHKTTGGAMGPLLHIAGTSGLTRPFAVPDDRILRLPAPT